MTKSLKSWDQKRRIWLGPVLNRSEPSYQIECRVQHRRTRVVGRFTYHHFFCVEMRTWLTVRRRTLWLAALACHAFRGWTFGESSHYHQSIGRFEMFCFSCTVSLFESISPEPFVIGALGSWLHVAVLRWSSAPRFVHKSTRQTHEVSESHVTSVVPTDYRCDYGLFCASP